MQARSLRRHRVIDQGAVSGLFSKHARWNSPRKQRTFTAVRIARRKTKHDTLVIIDRRDLVCAHVRDTLQERKIGAGPPCVEIQKAVSARFLLDLWRSVELTLLPPPPQMFLSFSFALSPLWLQVRTGLALDARLLTLLRQEHEPLQQSQYRVVFAIPV